MLSKLSVSAKRVIARGFHSNAALRAKDIVVLSAVRTPIGTFQGALSQFSSTQLGAQAAKEAIKRAGLKPEQVTEAFWGCVTPAGLGQAPCRQVAIRAGMPWSTVCTTVNKVCASGMKSIMLGAQSIMTGVNECVLAGGAECMSNVPFYAPKARAGMGYGHGQFVDGLIQDGLWDVYDNVHMGMCAEACATKYKITREEQDEFSINSFKKAIAATKAGKFKAEIMGVQMPSKDKSKPGKVVTEDENLKKFNPEKLKALKPAFKKDGTVTAGNASSLNDGASALIIASAEFAQKHNLKPLARIAGFGDAARKSTEFTVAPADAVRVALKHGGLSLNQMEYFEFNEAFAVVGIINQRLLEIDANRVNVNGGAVAIGHPIGCSGARIVATLINVLKQNKAKYGASGICNGGGGASALLVENI